MFRVRLIPIALILLSGCELQPLPSTPAQASQPSPSPAIPIEPSPPLAAAVAPTHPRTPIARASKDLPQCPGIRIRRPAGSNCYGILPTACGADKAKAYIGRTANPATRQQVAKTTGTASIRWIKPGEAVIENMDPSRLNMMLGERGQITLADCH